MNNWTEYKLSELMQIKYGKDHKHLADGTFPLYGSGGIMRYVEKPLYSEASILIPRKGTLSNLFYLDKPFWSVDTMFYSIINRQLALPKYLYYTLKTFDLASLNVGSAVPSLTTEVLNDVLVSVPNIDTQTAIAEILSSLDDKIELNNKINHELENLAQTLFKQWFIDFEFPNENGEPYKSSGGEMVESELGEIPKGWVVKRLKEILTIKRGGSPRPIQDFIAKNGLPWVKISDATAIKSPFLFSTKEFIKPEGLKKTVLMKKGSLVLSNSATPGLPIFLELDACIHDGWLHFQDIQNLTYNFLYLFFLTIREDLIGQGNGSIFVNLKTDILKEYRTSIPDANLISKFEDVIAPIFQSIKENSKEIIELTTLRDLILPKLISGELEVSEALTQTTA
jgi:type I restriction enzyme S subunit